MKNCAYCGRENNDEAAQCHECGTAFVTEPSNPQTSEPDASDNPARAASEKRMLYGAFWCMGGILVTVVSYLSAASSPFGGSYVFAWGAIVFGAVQFIQGLSGRDAQSSPENIKYEALGPKASQAPPRGPQSSSEDMGYEALACGTKLETAGRVPEALAVYREIAEKYPETEAGRDAKKSMESLQAKLG